MKKMFFLISFITISLNASFTKPRMGSKELQEYLLQTESDNYRPFHFQEVDRLECTLNDGNRLIIERTNEQKLKVVTLAIFDASLYSPRKYCIQIGTFMTIEEKKPLYAYLAKRRYEYEDSQKK